MDSLESASGMKKGPWTTSEDAILTDYVRKHGEGNWNAVQRRTTLLRCGKSCRLRWANHLRPNLKKGAFSPEEEFLILRLHAQLGNKWARMAALLPGRTDNEIKNYWNTRIKRWKRTGLPLYPPEILRQVAALRRRPPSPPTANPLSLSPDHVAGNFRNGSTAHQNMLLFSPNSMTGNPILELPRIKTFHEDYGHLQYNHHSDCNLNRLYNSSVSSAGGESTGSGMLEALLQRAQVGGQQGPAVPEQQLAAAGEQCGWWVRAGKTVGDCESQVPDSVSEGDSSDQSIGIRRKSELHERLNTKILDLEMQPASEVAKGQDPNIGGMHNGHTTSFLPIAPLDRDWHMRSCAWNNMPTIC